MKRSLVVLAWFVGAILTVVSWWALIFLVFVGLRASVAP